LKDETLTLNSPAAQFDGAYTNVILKDLRKEGGVYRLDGPWVRIVDKEPPSTPPSTSKDGHWSAKRGDNAFNDVMTYYHLDQAQRYLHGLGFASVINRPIEADSDAENGDDNSHHHPSANGKAGFLTFGHGCVPDNEDASVIWHEFGHAIHADIVALNWSGGDSGAIGEGFGDYWAASHNLSTQAGKGFKPGRVFKWDGIASCWGGRSVELQNFKYDPGRDYGAHQKLDPRFGNNSPATDELWSSPLFQAQLALIEKGKKREEADKIVVQSLFGLTSSGFKMRDVAQRIVNTAQKLFPNGPHAAIFLAKFQEYNICPAGVADACPDNPPMSKTGDPQEVTLAPSVKK